MVALHTSVDGIKRFNRLCASLLKQYSFDLFSRLLKLVKGIDQDAITAHEASRHLNLRDESILAPEESLSPLEARIRRASPKRNLQINLALNLPLGAASSGRRFPAPDVDSFATPRLDSGASSGASSPHSASPAMSAMVQVVTVEGHRASAQH